MGSILTAKNVIVSKRNNILIQIRDFSIQEGSFVTVIGENGAGKTTLLLALSSLIPLSSGEIYFKEGKIGEVFTYSEYRKKISIVFQENLLLNDTVFNNVAIGLKFREVAKTEIISKVNGILNTLKINHLKERKVNTLSGGEAKRVSIARALAVEPEILFLDEPFASLDAVSKEGIIVDLAHIIKEKKITTIMSTHDKYEALRLSDHIIALEWGRIVQKGTKEEIIHSPKSSFVASFMGVENVLEGIVVEKRDGGFIADIGNQHLEGIGDYEVGSRVILCIRPENVFLSKSIDHIKSSVRNFFHGTVAEINNYGHYYRVTVNCGFNIISYITKTSFSEMQIQNGDEVSAGFKATAVHTITKL